MVATPATSPFARCSARSPVPAPGPGDDRASLPRITSNLHARQVGTETEVGADTEGQVWVGRTPDQEPVRVARRPGRHGWPTGRSGPPEHPAAWWCRRARSPRWWCGSCGERRSPTSGSPPQRFASDRDQPGESGRSSGWRISASSPAGRCVARGLVAGDHQRRREHRQLVGVQAFVLRVGESTTGGRRPAGRSVEPPARPRRPDQSAKLLVAASRTPGASSRPPASIIVSVHAFTRGRSSDGRPNMSAMMRKVTGAATAATMSRSVGSRIESSAAAVYAAVRSRSSLTIFGVNCRDTRRRSRPCSGSSMVTNDSGRASK